MLAKNKLIDIGTSTPLDFPTSNIPVPVFPDKLKLAEFGIFVAPQPETISSTVIVEITHNPVNDPKNCK